MDKKEFGKTNKGEQAFLYTLTNANGLEARVTNYGAALVSVIAPDRSGTPVDVVLGYDTVSGYEAGGCFFGAIIGRSANRIKDAAFRLGEKICYMTANEGHNNLHSGPDGYDKRIWEANPISGSEIAFTLKSPNGDQGFPGNLDFSVTYHLTDNNELTLTYEGKSDKDTIWNPTNHSYFNLAGHDSGNVLAQKVMIDADAFTATDAESIPTGELRPVEGTPMDFRVMKEIGRDINTPYSQLISCGGYDHNWVLKTDGTLKRVAKMASDATGIRMEVMTEMPGAQFYTGNFVEREMGKNGAVYGKRQGFCFETQYFPNAVNEDAFAKPVLKAGEEKCYKTLYRFSNI